MSKRSVLATVLIGFGLVVLVWASVSNRKDPRTPRTDNKTVKKDVAKRIDSPVSEPATEPAPTTDKFEPKGDLDPKILERIRNMEDRVSNLQSKKETLAEDNKDLQRQLKEKRDKERAEATATWRVRSMAALLGLSEAQQTQLKDLWVGWGKEGTVDANGWLARENQLRAVLTPDQAMKLHDNTAKQAERQWSYMSRTIGSVAGIPQDQHANLQSALGNLSLPSSALMPEAHGTDWRSLMKAAADRARPSLNSEQQGKLDKYIGRFGG